MISIRLGHPRHGGDHLGCDDEAELRGEPRRPQHPQRVVGEGVLGRARRAEQPLRQVDHAAVRVLDDPAGQPHGHRVDGEVAAAEVALEGVAEVDGRLARGRVVGLGAVGRHLDGPLPLPAADGAEVAAHVPGRVTPLREQPLGVVGPRGGGEVEVGVRPAEHRVAHRPADQRQLVAGGREHARRGRRPPAPSAPARRPRCAGARPRSAGRTRVRTRGSTLGREARSTGLGTHRPRGLTSTHAPPVVVQCCPGGAGGPGAAGRTERTPTRAVRRARTRQRRPSCARSSRRRPRGSRR